MFFRMMVEQARHRWPVTLLLWVAMTALVSLYVYLGNSARFSNRSMQIIMKNMGHNIFILPRTADPINTYLCSDRQSVFPEDVAPRLAQRLQLPSKYYVAVLQKRLNIGGRTVLLTGIRPIPRSDETPEKRNMVAAIPPGSARVGSEAARVFGVSEGDSIPILSRKFLVSEVFEPQGAINDYRVYISLADCQGLLGKPNEINAILAFLCMHGGSLGQIIHRQDRLMAEYFPDFKAITRTDIARGRDIARRTTSGYLYYLLLLVLCITVVVIAVTGLQEVAERIREVGILLAMGASYPYIVGLYVLKLLAIALGASVAGFLIGSHLSLRLMTPVLVTNTRPVTILWSQLPDVMALTCVVAVLASILPMLKLLRTDPNAILIEE